MSDKEIEDIIKEDVKLCSFHKLYPDAPKICTVSSCLHFDPSTLL